MNPQAKHTPGEWSANWENGMFKVRTAQSTVAWVDFWQTPDCIAQKSEQEQQANASLLAAAPEMFAKIVELSNGLTVSGRKHYGLDELIAKAGGAQ